MNREQRQHLARSFQAIALSQLAFFGYSLVRTPHPARALLSAALYAMIEGAALLLLRGTS
jgi:hypothetical protein